MALIETLVCVYTCDADRPMLEAFHGSRIGACLREMSGASITEVYADPGVPASFHRGSEIVLRTPERYDALSLKTAEMIAYAVRNFEFRRLLKIDVTCVRTDFSDPGYEGRRPLDLEQMELFLRNADLVKDYDGFVQHAAATRQNAEEWAAKKRGVIDYSRLFGDSPMPPFFSGKCYFISWAFAQFIANAGVAVARDHASYMLGSEDTMVGRLYCMFQGEGR